MASGALSSSVLAAYEYDEKTRVLTLTFRSGRTYSYPGVPQEVVTHLANSASPGRTFNEEIKGVYG